LPARPSFFSAEPAPIPRSWTYATQSARKCAERAAAQPASTAASGGALMRLARVLVPINYTREARFRHDPAFACPPLPTIAQVSDLAAADPVRAGFIRTQLMRGQNRLTAAMRDAVRIVDAALR
jgi:hypothetical protein